MSHWERLKTLFASFCTEKEKESVNKYGQANNLSFWLAPINYKNIYQELKDTTMTDKMSPAKFSFILTVILNYLVCDQHETFEWKPDNVETF